MQVSTIPPINSSTHQILPQISTQTNQQERQEIFDGAFDHLGKELTQALSQTLASNRSTALGEVDKEMGTKTCDIFAKTLIQETTSQPISMQVPSQRIQLDSKLPIDTKAMIEKLDNGLTYCILRNTYPSKQTASLRLVVKAGSTDEEEGQQGLAHFLEHLTFLGTETYGDYEIKRLLESMGLTSGADINAHTSYDETVYKLDIPLDNPDLLDKALHFLREMATKAKILESSVSEERFRVLDEITKENANRRYFEKLFSVLLAGTPYPQRSPRGLQEVIRNCTSEQIRAFYEEFYQPQNIILIAIGDFVPEQVKTLIHKHFNDIPSSSNKTASHDFPQIKQPELQFVCQSDPESTYSFLELWYPKKVSGKSKKGTVEWRMHHIINQLYTLMFNRRLLEIVTNSESPPFSTARWLQTTLAGKNRYNRLSMTARDGKISEAYKSLLLEFKRVEEHGFLDIEFEYAKTIYLANLERSEKEKDQIATKNLINHYIAFFTKDKPILHVEKKFEITKKLLESINVKHVHLWHKILHSAPGKVASTLIPEKSENNISPETLMKIQEEVAIEKALPYSNTFTQRSLLRKTPKAGKIIKTTFYEKTAITEWTLENGMRVFVKYSNQKEDTITMGSLRNGGYLSAPIEMRAAANMSIQVCLSSEKGGLSPSQFDIIMAGKNIRHIYHMSNYLTGYFASPAKKDLEATFQVLHTVYTDQIYTKKAFDRLKKKHANDAKYKNNHPDFLFPQLGLSLRTQDHPRFKPISEDEYEKAEHKDCIEFLNNQFQNPSDFDLFIMGNIDLKETRQLVKKYLAGIPGKGRQTLNLSNTRFEYPRGIVVKEIKAGISNNCKTHISFPAPTEDGFESRVLGDCVAHLLTMYLKDKVACGSKKSYRIHCQYTPSSLPGLEEFHPSSMELEFTGLPENIHETNQAVLDILRSLQADGFDKNTVDSYKTQLKETFRKRFDIDSEFLSIFSSAVRWEYDLNELVENYKQLIDRFDEKMATEIFRKLFSLDRYVQTTLLPKD